MRGSSVNRIQSSYSRLEPAGYRIWHIKRFLELLGITDAFFVGGSSGGGTILPAAVMDPIPFQIQKMVTICGNASVFKTNFQADLENYTPSIENIRKIVDLLYHDPKWQTPENIQERYEASTVPGAWEALSAARLRSPAHQPRSTTDAFVRKLSQLRIPLLIMSCEHDPLNQKDWDVEFQKLLPGSKSPSFHELIARAADRGNRVLTEFLTA